MLFFSLCSAYIEKHFDIFIFLSIFLQFLYHIIIVNCLYRYFSFKLFYLTILWCILSFTAILDWMVFIISNSSVSGDLLFLMSTHLVTDWKVLTILRTSTDFLTQTFIYMAASLIWAIATVILIVTKTSTGNAPAIFAHKKWTVAWLFWKKKIKQMEHKGLAIALYYNCWKHSQIW